MTHYCSQTNSYSLIDLTLCSADCQVDFVHTVLEDLYDSDHYPIHVVLTNNDILPLKVNKFNIEKADWTQYEQLTNIYINQLPDVERATDIITEILIGAAELSIPRVKRSVEQNKKA